ncbi:nuclear pore complex protein NUP214 isoform X1 [Hordeum vulgare subsp. vulgare]|uniref:nuclear pore complex protein NUP214 isoform X1 n=1 Tax=Hordeum vulgare subsp. vulgare TaxID=112509 RepID=UPI001D1A331D|nr:nuclear pore complex protein NUP214 isoform X1 [Hordeum vulgare subsp. vulgare]
MAAPRELDLSDEVEGEMDGTTDFVFRLVGDPIPVLPPASAPFPLFDLQSPPARPLAVSDRHAAVFLAHPNGFIAARTKALIEASKEAREKGKASTRCAQDCCVTDVSLPGVTLLALSRDESVLAACTGSEIQFFSATSLLTDKAIESSSSCSLGRSGTVKDFKWLDHGYIVLSNGGLLSHGSLGQGLKDVMENVDAVDCCKDGNHIAVARKNSLRILSSDLKETCCMALLFQLWPGSDSEGTDIKVDSIGWVRDDSIVVGCVRLNEESDEEGYLVQVIRSGGDTFFESSSKPVVYSYDVFGGIMDDILPSGVGPNLLLGYLHCWDLLVVSNKKSTDDHISLLKWPSRTDEERTVVYLEMVEDKYIPRIDLQENGDDNVILGFGVENVSLFQKIIVLVGPEQKEVAPQHLLLCLTSEGKLVIYYLARISDPSDLPQTSLSTIEDSNVNKQISPATASNKDLTPNVTSSMAKSLLAPGASSAPAEKDQHGSGDAKSSFPVSNSKDIAAGSSLLISSDKKPLDTKQVNMASPFAPPSSSVPTGNMKPGMPFSFSTGNNVGLNSTGSKGSSEPVSSWQPNNSGSFVSSQLGKGGFDSAKPLGTFGGSQNAAKSGGSLSFKSSLFSSDGAVPVKTAERDGASSFGSYSAQTSYTTERKVLGSSASLSSAPSLSISPNKPVGVSAAGFGAGNLEVPPTSRGSPLPQQTIAKSHNNRNHTSVNSKNFKLGTMFDAQQDLSKKIYSINDMTEELDTLLAYIEKDGGFRDACMTLQQRPLSVLEGDLQNLLELLQVFKNKVEEQCSKAEDLRNKMFQVSARQAYMKGILSQSSDTQYWDIWNRQNLSPEFEAKRQNILKANQNLTNQLVELERHFNNLEMNKFGETGRVASSRRAVYSNKSRSSQTQLSSVYNALNSQLAAAEQLSECLSKQISALNISSPSKKRGAVTKELFESIGLAHTTDATKFSGSTPSKLIQRFPSTKEHTKGMLGPSKSTEPETARRRRESLDMSLASLEPQKTTVKRIAQQQRLKISGDLPFRSNKKMFDSQMAAISQETFGGSPSSSIVESYTSRVRSPTEVLDEKTKPSGPQGNSLFKWVKEPAGPSQGSDQKHFELSGRMRSADQSSKLAPSLPASFSYTQKDASDRISSPNVASLGTMHTMPKSNTLTFKTTIAPKTNANTRPDMSPSVSSPMPFKTLSGDSGAGSTLTTKNRYGDQDVPSFGSMKGFGISPQNTGVNKPSLSSEPSEPSKPVVLHGKTFQLSGVSDTMQNSAKASAQVAFSPTSQSSLFPMMSGASSSSTSLLSTMQASAAKTSDLSSPTVSSTLPPQKSTPKTPPTVPEAEGTVSSSLPSIPTPVKESLPDLNKNVSKPEVVTPEVTGATVSVSATLTGVPTSESKTALLPVANSSLPSNPPSIPVPKTVPGATESAVVTSTRKDAGPSNLSSDEDEMEEERPSASADLNLGALSGFGLGSAPSSSPKKSNPFGSSFGTSESKSSGSPFTLTTSPGQLFRPASLTIPSSQPAQPSQSTSSSTFSSAFSSGLGGFGQSAQVGAGQQSGFGQSAQIGAGQQAGFGQPAQIQSGFGQPAQIGSAQQSGFGQPAQIGGGQQSGFGQPSQLGAQQALGSVLGSFGQSRQLGGFGGFASSSSGAFASAPSSNSGFAGAAAGGGFSAAATSAGGGFAAAATGGGFASLASKSGGGFAAAASSAGGFGGAAQGGGFGGAAQGGGFGGAAQGGGFGGAAQGGGFGGAAQGGGFGGGGFGAFGSNNQGATGFSSFGGGGAAGPGRPPADFLTQMRK